MSQEWIKVCKDTDKKPEVIAIATRLGLARSDVLGRLVLVWSWADSHTLNGVVQGATTPFVNELVGTVGFAEAMAVVGWLTVRNNGLEIPNFDFHMGNSAKRRAQHTKNVRAKRAPAKRTRSSLISSPSVSSSLPKEEKAKPPSKADDFEAFWRAYPRGRKEGKGKAREAWAKAIEKAPALEIISAVTEYAQSPRGQGEFVKQPATWLNGECWNDDRAAWQRRDDTKLGVANTNAVHEAMFNFAREGQAG